MSEIVVKYNGISITPAPLVQQSYQFLDYGSRWGNITEIELNGNVTGISNPTATQSGFAAKFTGQFGTLEVLDGTSSLYKWNNVIVSEISFPLNHLFLNSIAPYSVKMKSVNVPSGVIDPINEYNFNQGEDGIVTVGHRISARGIKTQNGALNNAIAFVQNFTGQSPFVAPFSSYFIPTGSGILSNFSEAIDRAQCTYTVQETYKYNTGLVAPYVETWSSSVSDIMDNEWLTIEVDWKLQGSPVKNNITQVETSLSTNNPLNKLSAMGYSTGNLIQSDINYSRDTGAASIQIRASYVSGYSLADISGYLDYTVNLTLDEITPKEDWRIDGDFVCFGPRDYRASRLNSFKSANGSDWRNYLTGLIIASPIFSQHDSSKTFGSMSDVDIHENTGLAQFHISLSTVDGGYPGQLLYPKYSLEIQPNKWTYDLLPSANIEGHYVLQDLQMMSQAKITLTVNGVSSNVVGALATASGSISDLSSVYVKTGFIVAESYNTGLLDVSISQEWLGFDKIASGILYSKVAGSTLTNYLRPKGYKFGY